MSLQKKKFDSVSIITMVVIVLGILAIVFFCLMKFDGVLEAKRGITFVGFIKDYLNGVFFLVVGILSILSYLQARKTIFTPIKTEIFKYQLKTFEEILQYFQYKTETDFTECFDLDFIVSGNAFCVFDDYVNCFFKKEVRLNQKKHEERFKKFSGALVTEDFANKNWFKPDSENYKEPEIKDNTEPVSNPAIILARWQEYDCGMIHYTRKHQDQMNKLRHFVASPLIPDELKNIIRKFEEIAEENLRAVGTVLTRIAKEFPQKYPNVNSFKKIDLLWVWNEYNDEMKHLEPTAKEILDFINKYLDVDDLIN